MTRHAKTRGRQRGFSDFALRILRELGREEKAPGGAIRLFFGHKEYQAAVGEFKRAIQLLDKVKDGTMLIKDEDVLTVYK